MSAQPSGAIARVRYGLRFGDVDHVASNDQGAVTEVIVRFDDGQCATFHRPEIDELVWL